MIIALLLQLVAIVTSLLGLNCIKIGSTDEQTKAKIATAAGVIGILGGESALLLSCLSERCRGDRAVLAGLSCLVAVSWYANQVVQEFYSPLSAGIRSVPHTLASSCKPTPANPPQLCHCCRFELGTGLYLGWGGATLSVLGGALLCCACRRASGGPKGYG